MSVTFEGPVVRLLSTTASSRGKALVSLDGGVPVEVDLYSPTTQYQQVVFEASGLGDGVHTLTVSPTQTKNAASVSTWVEIDAIEAVGVVPLQRFEEDAAGLVFSSGWGSFSGGGRSGGVAAAGYLSSLSMSVTFEGPMVRLLSTTASSRGKALVSLDGGVPVEVDLYSPTTQYQQVVFEASGLGDGVHTLTVSPTQTKNAASVSTWVEIDAIEAVGVVPLQRFEEDAAGLVFSSGWGSFSGGGRSGGVAAAGYLSSLSMSVTFEGPMVRLLSTTASSRGKALVSLDGGVPVEVDLYSPTTQYQQVVFEASGLGDGVHTLTVSPTQTKNAASVSTWVEIDAIEAVGVVP